MYRFPTIGRNSSLMRDPSMKFSILAAQFSPVPAHIPTGSWAEAEHGIWKASLEPSLPRSAAHELRAFNMPACVLITVAQAAPGSTLPSWTFRFAQPAAAP